MTQEDIDKLIAERDAALASVNNLDTRLSQEIETRCDAETELSALQAEYSTCHAQHEDAEVRVKVLNEECDIHAATHVQMALEEYKLRQERDSRIYYQGRNVELIEDVKTQSRKAAAAKALESDQC